MGKVKISFENFKKRFDARAGEDFEYIGGYQQMSKKITVRCLKCQHVFDVVASAFVGSKKVEPSGCNACANSNRGEEGKESFLNLIENEGYSLKEGNYLNKKSVLILHHNSCGSDWKTRPQFFIKGIRCPYCGDGGKRHVYLKQPFEKIKEELEKKFNIEVIKDIDIKTPNLYKRKIRFRHLACDHVEERHLASLKQNSVAPTCKVCKKQITQRKLLMDISHSIAKKEQEMKQDKNALLKKCYYNIELHNTQGYLATHICGTRNHILNLKKHKCICEQRVFNKTNAKKRVHFLSKGVCELVSPYKDSKTKVLICNKECNHIYEISPETFLRSQRCRICYPVTEYRNHPYTIEELQSKIDDIFGNKIITILSKEYINLETPIEARHYCGEQMLVTPGHLLSKESWETCKGCSDRKSHGEKKIFQFLTNNNYNFIQEFSFDDCRYKLPLRFDFIVFNKDSSIRALIEFDGAQHFREVEYFGDFEVVQKRDEIKNKYCKQKGYKLIRIPYNKERQIEDILSREL